MTEKKSFGSRFTSALCKRIDNMKNSARRLARDTRGEGYLDMAMKILIVVVVGAAILAIMNAAMPNLFQSLITKVSGQINGITILP